MKRLKFAAAVVAALPAFAFAQTSVTLFGILDTSLNFVNAGGSSGQRGSSTQLVSGVAGQSRWGVRGVEDLGGGLSALFHIEGAIKSDDGTGTASGALNFQRRAVVGLGGGFGTVWLGRDYTPGFQSASGSDVGFAAGWQYGLYGTHLLNWTVDAAAVRGIRWDNGIHYVSPNFGGLVVRAAYSAGERDITPNKSSGNNLGISFRYDNGPVNAYFYAHDMKDPAGVATKTKQQGLGGAYTFGDRVRLSVGYGVTDPDGVTKFIGTNVGVAMRAGPGWIMGQVHSMKEDSTKAKGNTLALSYVYPLSKRTDLIASGGIQKNNDAGNFALRASDFQVAPAAAGSDPKGFGLGIAHRF
jgi:predicted porin